MRRLTTAVLVCIAIWLTGASGQQTAVAVPPYVPGELLVKFQPNASQTRRDSALARAGAHLIRAFAAFDLHHVGLPFGMTVEDAIATLRANPDVLFAQPNFTRHITQSSPPNDPLWLNGSLWGLLAIQAPSVWQNYTTGNGSVVVADIDTGVNYNHPDLAANIWTNPLEIPGNGIDDDGDGYIDDVHGINVLNGSGDPMDDHGHGTHTAGTMAAVGNNGVGVVGVNWNAKILACKFLNSSGSGSDAGAIACFNYITTLKQRGENIRVSNNSWGGSRTGGIDQALQSAITAAGTAGILNAFAAGNNGTNNDSAPFDPASMPVSSIIAVAASDGGDNRAGFSNYGNNSVHLAAPGVSITSTYLGDYGTLSGTSMATPHVAGTAALIALLNPSFSPETIKAVLMNNVDVLPQWSGLVASGGRLNAFKAAAAVVGNTPPTVTLTSPANGTNFVPPATITLTATAGDSDGSVTSVAFYAGNTLLATRTTSPYSFTWSGMASGSYVLKAVATDNKGVTTPSNTATITVNTLPTVTLTSPSAGAVFTAPATVTLSATASDSDGTISSVKFFAGSTLIATKTSSPYTFSWTAVAAGTYSITAVATDNLGGTKTSTAAPITVNAKPTVSLTAPSGGSVFTAPATVTVSATASDSDGTVASVAFFANGNAIGTATTSPYSVTWSNVAAGAYSLTAMATDNLGATTTSTAVSITVNPVVVQSPQSLLTTQVPDVVNASDSGQSYELGVTLRSDVAGLITAIRFWKGSAETGTHVGRIWSAGGQLLASVTFTNETASGWQQQSLTSSLAIVANTNYVVSVPTSANNLYVYATSAPNAFTNVVANGHLQTSGPNGGRYGTPGAFPSNATFANYFRDVVFAATTSTDTTPPTVAVTQPVGGSTVGGAVSVAATASDDVGVVGVQFQMDGGNVGAEQAQGPYGLTWDSTLVSNGPHTWTAVARDAAGHTTTSAPVTVTVSNTGPPPSQTLLTTQVPDAVNASDGGQLYELGVQLHSDVAGQITALRYWKGSAENGPHVGHVWTAAGQLLATVTFASETASGWQQQALTTPVTIQANTDYVVSVATAPNSLYSYAVSSGASLATAVTNGHLQSASPNGGRYGAPGAFPANTSLGNYFRDAVFVANTSTDTTPPTVTLTQPAAGSTVGGAVTVAATASDDVGVVGVQFQIDGVNFGAEQTQGPYGFVWDSTTVSNGPHTLTAVARDAAGHTASSQVTVTVSNAAPPPSQTLLTTQVPEAVNASDGGRAYELGVSLRSDVPGQITAIRFWKGSAETGTHVGRIWSAAGQLLASVTFTNETASGWQQQSLGSPLAILANTDYVVSVPTSANNLYVYATSAANAFTNVVTNGHLQTSGPNGGRYGTPGALPPNATLANYFRDAVFAPTTGPDTTPPTVTLTQPAAGSTVGGAVSVAATASDDVGVVGVQFQIDGVNFGAEQVHGPYGFVWDSTTVSNSTHTLTAVARDAAGHTASSQVTVTVLNTGQVSQTLLTTQVPDAVNASDGGQLYELGVQLHSDVAGQITALRYWKGSAENGPHVGHVWTAAGQLLATVTFANETASGWQQQALTTPVTIQASTDYVVSVATAPNSLYSYAVSAGASLATAVTNGHLQSASPNGGRYGVPGAFPANTSLGNYFRDVVFVAGGSAPALQPNPVVSSDLDVRVDFVGQIPTRSNPTSPTVAGSQLLLIDQGGYIYKWNGTTADNLLTPSTFPQGIFPPGGESVLNVAANLGGSLVYVMFSTFTAPSGIPISISPRPTDSWQVLYQYSFDGTTLSNPQPIRAFQVRSGGHTGGGLAVLSDGSVLCAIGDNGDAGEDGRSYAQDPTNHLSKILRINPTDASAAVVALGVRNVQRLALYGTGTASRLDFADIGGYIAEELNSIPLSTLLDGSTHNFGWGRNAVDGKAREGTLYIDSGGTASGAAPVPEAGYLQPVAQFGRESATLIAASGPVSSAQSFFRITSLFGDLPSGTVYAITGALTQTVQPVFRVNLFDSQMQSTTLFALAGGRPDVRFFNFPDGTAGVLLEATGNFYRLTETR